MEKPKLETITYTFTQEGNCVDGRDTEELIIEAKSSLGIECDEGAFLVLKTDRWAIDDVKDIEELITKVENSIKIFTDKPKEKEDDVDEYVIINNDKKLYTKMTKHHHEQLHINLNDYSKNLFFTVDKKNIIDGIVNGDKYYICHDNNYIPVYYNYKQELVSNGLNGENLMDNLFNK